MPHPEDPPYWVPDHLTRRDITEHRPGLPLELVLAIQNARTCKRIKGADVDPGWYRGRTTHIHVKVHAGGDVVHTGQLCFSDRTSAAVYRQAPYKTHGTADTRNAADMIYVEAGRTRSMLKLARRGQGKPGYRGSIILGVAT
jgi:hypothetical protein